jgi:hypothetical protein
MRRKCHINRLLVRRKYEKINRKIRARKAIAEVAIGLVLKETQG